MESLDARLRELGFIPYLSCDTKKIATTLAMESVNFRERYEEICVIPPNIEFKPDHTSVEYIFYARPTPEYKKRLEDAALLLTCLSIDPETKDLVAIRV